MTDERRKIVFHIHSLAAGGAERVTSILANYWARKGWDVTVITIAGIDSDFYALDTAIKRVGLNLEHNNVGLIRAVFNNIKRISALRNRLKSIRPHVAISMMATANIRLAVAGKGLGIELIGSERTHPPAMPLGFIWELMRKWTYPLLSVLVAQTERSAIWIRDHLRVREVQVIPNPVDTPLSSTWPYVAVESVVAPKVKPKILLAVGRLSEEKRFDVLLNIFSRLLGQHPEWMLVILGDGMERGSLRGQMRALGIERSVRLPGVAGNVCDWFEAADLYALTSRVEGFPNTLLEALAHGVPAVAMDCDAGPADIVRDGIDGYLVTDGDEVEFGARLDRLMSSSSLRHEFGVRALEAQSRFAVKRIASMWESLFSR